VNGTFNSLPLENVIAVKMRYIRETDGAYEVTIKSKE
jgi:hypothetical protein